MMYNAVSGLPSMFRALTDESMRTRGFATMANAQHDMASIGKMQGEMRRKAEEAASERAGRLGYVAGKHGVDSTAVANLMRQIEAGQSPDLTPFGDKGNAVMRDIGAHSSGHYQHIPGYEETMAKLPVLNLKARAATDLFDQLKTNPGALTPEAINKMNAVVGGHMIPNEPADPSGIRTFEAFQRMSPAEQAAYIKLQQAIRPQGTTINMPNATSYGTNPQTGQPGLYQIGRDGTIIFTPINPPPPPPEPTGPQSNIGKLLRDRERGMLKPGGAVTPVPDKGGAGAIPPEARAKLKEGVVTTFNNGQSWTLKNGEAVRVK
jgi:hypothetical protein